jgi:geranylgeranyl pyrophosphate synthase
MIEPAVLFDRPTELVALLDRIFEKKGLERLAGGAAAEVPWRLWRASLYAPLSDFLNRPGKEFRGELLRACFRLGKSSGALPVELPLVVEALHAGSLIVDDIEDESFERRGAPALHRIYGTATALNAGNWLYFFALGLLDELFDGERLVAAHRLAGTVLLECHHGQALDISVNVVDLAQNEIPGVVQAVSALKTGGLVGLGAALGALAGGADMRVVDGAMNFGRGLGTGLQMLDDLSGIARRTRQHKGAEDLSSGRVTWPWAWAAETLSTPAFERLRRAGRAVVAGSDPDELSERLRETVVEYGKARVHAHLMEALERFSAAVPDPEARLALGRQIERLEHGYV